MHRRLSLLAVVTAAAAIGACAREPHTLLLATTTTIDNSGLLPALVPQFERTAQIKIKAIIGGSGRALDLLDRGDADVAMTHDPEAERKYFDRGDLALYRKVMFNDFVIAGPAADPAGVAKAAGAAEAMARIASSGSPFASRADSSGTHSRELSLWAAAGKRPPGALLIETGQGMAATLRVASERQAYVLTDRSTFHQIQDTLQLQLLFEHDPALVNTYAVMYKKTLKSDRMDLARRFSVWLTEGVGRDAIAEFQIKGQPAFTVWPSSAPRDRPGDLPDGR